MRLNPGGVCCLGQQAFCVVIGIGNGAAVDVCDRGLEVSGGVVGGCRLQIRIVGGILYLGADDTSRVIVPVGGGDAVAGDGFGISAAAVIGQLITDPVHSCVGGKPFAAVSGRACITFRIAGGQQIAVVIICIRLSRLHDQGHIIHKGFIDQKISCDCHREGFNTLIRALRRNDPGGKLPIRDITVKPNIRRCEVSQMSVYLILLLDARILKIVGFYHILSKCPSSYVDKISVNFATNFLDFLAILKLNKHENTI